MLDRCQRIPELALTAKVKALSRAGAAAAVADALDFAAVREALFDFRPEVVIHEMTAISNASDLAHLDRAFAATNRLRTDGVDYLLAAARESEVRRFIAQSFCGWPFARIGGPVKTEEDRVSPVTECPAATSRGTRRLPTAPVAPATRMRIGFRLSR
jgi:hypothetical protein